MFLKPSELAELTGYVKPSLQCKWLAKHGYAFDVRADGRPAVSRAHYESRQAVGKARRVSGMNLSALDKTG